MERTARWFERALLVMLVASGLLHPRSVATWYACLGAALLVIGSVVLGGAALVTGLTRRRGRRVQGPRRSPEQNRLGALTTSSAVLVAACLAAWPLAQAVTGQPTGMRWTLEGAGGNGLRLVLEVVGALLVMDAWLYWKHRLLHTRWLWAFHRAHHVHRDPTALASFAVGPVESLLTFWPILLLCLPEARHFGPAYFTLVIAFITLNLYLHCGVTAGWIEAVLGPLAVNTSAFHNVHHSNARVNFGEAFTLWDRICHTRERDPR
jgi:lathosterol oxidase